MQHRPQTQRVGHRPHAHINYTRTPGKQKENQSSMQLEARLEDIPEPVILMAKPQFHAMVKALTGMLQDIIQTTVPMSKPSPHAKR
jgi:hypothetical protein